MKKLMDNLDVSFTVIKYGDKITIKYNDRYYSYDNIEIKKLITYPIKIRFIALSTCEILDITNNIIDDNIIYDVNKIDTKGNFSTYDIIYNKKNLNNENNKIKTLTK